MRRAPPPRPPGTVGTLSRDYCAKCGDVTLHQHNRCGHCQTERVKNTVRAIPRKSFNEA